MAIPARKSMARQLGFCIVLAIQLAGLAACANNERQEETSISPDTSSDSCGRVEAASRFSLLFFDVMGEMGEDCAEGDALACNPANYAIGGLAGIVFMPMGFVIGLASPEIEDHHCAQVRQQNAARKTPETREEKQARLWARAAEGDARAQYDLGEQLFEAETGESQRAAWYWFCRAAHQRHAQAQYRLGGYYKAGLSPVSQDLLEAYLWYELAADQHVSAAAEERSDVSVRLNAKQIAQAERRAAEWQPEAEACSFNSAGDTALLLEKAGSDDR